MNTGECQECIRLIWKAKGRYNDAGWQRPFLRKETYFFQCMEDQNLWSGTDVDNEMAFNEYIFPVQGLKAIP